MKNSFIQKTNLIVAVSEIPPLVMKKGKNFSGFEIELWKIIAKKLKLNFQYKKIIFSKIFDYIRDGNADVAIAGITINKEREEMIDFTHDTLQSGLLVLISKNRDANIFRIIKNLIKNGYKKILKAISGIIFFIIVFGNVIWFTERGVGTFNNHYFPGVFESFWWAIVTMSTVGYGDFVPHSWIGRIFSTLIILGGYVIFGFFIAETSSLIMISRLQSTIRGREDLVGKAVATVKKTISVEVLEKMNAKVVKTKDISKAYEMLKNGSVDAVVFDAPSLLYFVKNDGRKDFEIVGDVFNPHVYGIVIKEGSVVLRELINRVLLEIRESGEYDRLYQKWFGDNTKME